MTKFKYAFDDNKRYHTWNYYLRNTFGEKVFKVSLNGGFTCPNLDGKTEIDLYYLQDMVQCLNTHYYIYSVME